MKRKIISLTLCLAIALSAVLSVSASDNEKPVILTGEETQTLGFSQSVAKDNPGSSFNQSGNPNSRAWYNTATENGQNKSNWCWATVAGMTGNRYQTVKGYSRKIPANNRVVLNNTAGVREGFAGSYNGKYVGHSSQTSIVQYIKGGHYNYTGSGTDFINGVKYASNAKNIAQYGNYKDYSLRNSLGTLRANMNKGYWMAVNCYNTSSGLGHSLLMSSWKQAGTSYQYYIHDPWYNTGAYYSEAAAFTNGIRTPVGTVRMSWAYVITD